jgi:hypothetical protein
LIELQDKPLREPVTDEEAWAYERMVERLAREAMVGHDGGTTRTVLAVEVRGHHPSAQVVASFGNWHDGSEGEAEWELWDPGSMLGTAEFGWFWEAPSDVVSSLCASWFRPDVERIIRPPDARPGCVHATRRRTVPPSCTAVVP